MGIQNSINSLLGTAATIAEVANISKGIKVSNALKAEEINSTLQGKELDVHGAILQDKTGIHNTENKIDDLNKELEDLKSEKARLLWSTPDDEANFKKREEQIGFNIEFQREAMRNLEGQLKGKRIQLNDIRARMKRMNVQSLLPEGGNE